MVPKNGTIIDVGRIDRIARLRAMLAASERTTIDVLAAGLAVSRRTVLRDLALLRDQGVPIEGEPGAGGGVRLLRDRGVTAVHLAFEEIMSLWLAASLARRGTALPWGHAANAALDKLLSSVSRERARQLRALLRRVVIGPPATARMSAGAGIAARSLLACLEDALRSGRVLAFDYRDREGRASTRTVEPHGLLVQPPVWYILGVDTVKKAERMFRMDRIARPRVDRSRTFSPSIAVVESLTADLVVTVGP